MKPKPHWFLTTTVRQLPGTWREALQASKLPPEMRVYLSATSSGHEWGFDRSRATIWNEAFSRWRAELWFVPALLPPVHQRSHRVQFTMWMSLVEVPAEEFALRELAEVR